MHGLPASSDFELLARTQQRDVHAFEALFRRYHQPLCDFVASYLGTPAAAEDVVQDLFAELWTSSATWRVHSTLRAYLFAAARNRALKQLRKDRRIVPVDPSDEESTPSSDPADSMELELESAAAIESLRHAIERLPPRTRLAITLRWGQEMSHAEIAEAMDISLKGVEKLLAVGMVRLREALRRR